MAQAGGPDANGIFTYRDWATTNTTVECSGKMNGATPAYICMAPYVLSTGGNPGTAVRLTGDIDPNAWIAFDVTPDTATYTPTAPKEVCRVVYLYEGRAYNKDWSTTDGSGNMFNNITLQLRLSTNGVERLLTMPAPEINAPTEAWAARGMFSYSRSYLEGLGFELNSSPISFEFFYRVDNPSSTNIAHANAVIDNVSVQFVRDDDTDGVCNDEDYLADGSDCSTHGDASCNSGICDSTETPATCEAAGVCGNSRVDAATEVCDDGNTTSMDGCVADCTYADNQPDGSDCSVGGTAACESGICDTTETPATCEAAGVCGNNIVEEFEACDDGRRTTGDGCGNTCLFEVGEACTANKECETLLCDAATEGATTVCTTPMCGDGKLEGYEVCDSSEGCSSNCLLTDSQPCAYNAQCDLGACDLFSVNAAPICDSADSDGDGVPNSIEKQDGTDPQSNNVRLDTDGDAAPDFVEVIADTNADDADSTPVDTDGDAVPDVVELRDGTDPSNNNDFRDDNGDGRPNYLGEFIVDPPDNPQPGASSKCSAGSVGASGSIPWWCLLALGSVAFMWLDRKGRPQIARLPSHSSR